MAILIEMAVHAVSLPRLTRWLGFTLATSDGDAHGDALGDAHPELATPNPPFRPDEARRVRAALRIMRHWPFGRGACLRQALLLGRLLRARQPVLHLGVAAHGREMTAHAWVQVSGVTIGGREGFLPLLGRQRGEDR